MDDTERARVVIFRDHLGVLSERFIYSQAAALHDFEPYFVGSRLRGEARVPADRLFVLRGRSRTGWFREAGLKLLQFAPRMKQHLAEVRPALIHAHFGPDATVVGPIADRLGIPLVTTFHGYDATTHEHHVAGMSPTYRLYRHRKAWLQERGALFIGVSDFICRRLVEQGFPPTRVVRHYVGVDLGEFAVGNREGRDRSVLFVGRLVENKGCAFLIEAMAEVQRRGHDSELIVIGDGPLRRDLERRAGELRVRARFLGAQESSVVRDHMARAAAFSVPSITIASGQSEGFGIVFVEAAAMGTPTASFSTGGIPEAVEHGVTGLLAPERDVRQLAEHIATLLGDSATAERMRLAGIQRVRRMFDIRSQTRELEELYRRAIVRAGNRSPSR